MRRLRRPVRSQSGYTVVELIIVMAILGVIIGGLTTAFVQGSTAEVDANRRVQSQLQANAAFDRLRRDVHCASSGAVTDSGATLTLTGCSAGTATWRACGGTNRYALYRNATTCPTPISASCDTAPPASDGKLYADCLTSSALFAYTAPSAATSLAKVSVDVLVNANPAKTVEAFELQDTIFLRNSTRT
jgi:prepilin-type N-terminal cleavage/methylation domain-containing protein